MWVQGLDLTPNHLKLEKKTPKKVEKNYARDRDLNTTQITDPALNPLGLKSKVP